MFEGSESASHQEPTTAPEGLLDAATLTAWATALTTLPEATGDDSARVDALRALEVLKCAAAAAQAELAVGLDVSMRQRAADRGVAPQRQGRGIAHQVALARRESPHRGQIHLGLAKSLLEMPHTRAAFRDGRITEWAATILVRETACLELKHRAAVDKALAADAKKLETMSQGQLAGHARSLAAKLDPGAVAARRAKAEAERRVTIRPAPDTMTYLTGLLPVKQGVAVFAALTREADSLRAAGDQRPRAQIMADTLVARVTGQTAADAVPVAINLVVSEETLLGGGSDPAHLDGYGAVPADLARDLVLASLDTTVGTWLRKLYAAPHGGLVAMDSLARLVPAGLAKLIRFRDGGICRTLWCDAPVRHVDHATGIANGGLTDEEDLQGLCEACNYAKQAPGWTAAGQHPPDGRHQVTTTTPTGHTYTSVAPPLPGWNDPEPAWLRLVPLNLQDPTDLLEEYELDDHHAA